MVKIIAALLIAMVQIHGEDNSITQNNVFGLSWDASSDEVKQRFQDMIGVIVINEDEKMYLLNSTTAIVMKGEQISEVHIGSSILDYELKARTTGGEVFSGIKVGPGIRLDMSYDEVNNILGKKISKEDYQVSGTHDGLKYQMRFSSMRIMGGEAEFKLMAVKVLRPNVAKEEEVKSELDEF